MNSEIIEPIRKPSNADQLELCLKTIIDGFQEVKNLINEKGRGEILWPLRAALSGRKASPGPYEIAEALGKEKVLKRIRDAKECLG